MNSTQILLRRGVDWLEGSGAAFRVIDSSVVFAPIASPVLPSPSGHPYEPTDEPGSAWLFREDSFDPVTRIRRGRLYRYDDTHRITYQNKPIDYRSPQSGNHTFTPDAAFVAFFPGAITREAIAPLERAQMEIGVAPFQSRWRVVGAEGIPVGAGAQLLLTLKAVSSLGALPELKEDLKSKAGTPIDRESIQDELDKLVETFHRQQSMPIVEVSREASRVILAQWLSGRTGSAKPKDLGGLVKVLDDHKVLQAAGHIVNRLHSRGKSSEREAQVASGHRLRVPVDEDADLSVRLVGFILRDIGWSAP